MPRFQRVSWPRTLCFRPWTVLTKVHWKVRRRNMYKFGAVRLAQSSSKTNFAATSDLLSSPMLAYIVIWMVLQLAWVKHYGSSLRAQFKCAPNVLTWPCNFEPPDIGARLSGPRSSALFRHWSKSSRWSSLFCPGPLDCFVSNSIRFHPLYLGVFKLTNVLHCLIINQPGHLFQRPVLDWPLNFRSFQQCLSRVLAKSGRSREGAWPRPTPVLAALLTPQLPPSFMEFISSMIIVSSS